VARRIDGRVSQALVSLCFAVRFVSFFSQIYLVFLSSGFCAR
jgi:hypothetical protein